MKYIESILYIDFADMVAAGIPEVTIRVAKQRGSQGWNFIDDPADRRKVLIEYEPLKDQYKESLKRVFGCPHQYIRQSAVKNLVENDLKALDFYNKYKLDDDRSLRQNTKSAYTKAASWLNMLIRFNSSEPRKTLKSLGMESRREFYDACVAIIKAENIDLPTNYSRLLEKVRTYEQDGYVALISKKFGNANSQKISTEAGEWLCAFYSNPFPKHTIEQTWMAFNRMAKEKGWQELEHHNTIYQYLYRTENVQRWYGNREGWDKDKERFGIQAKTHRASMRDSLWFADGTGFNFIAHDSKMQRVYWVMDDHSEVILGWDVDVSENEKSVYRAFKNAVNFSGHKPYEIRYDQSKTHMAIGPFLDNIAARLHFKTEAYNGKSKSIESATLRFQRYVMSRFYFFSGQNRGSRADRSNANKIAQLEVSHLMPDFESLVKIFEQCVREWNQANHHKVAKPRLDCYLSSTNPKAVAFSEFDAVEAFWNTARRPITYNAAGLLLEVHQRKHLFEVYRNGQADLDFRKKYIGAKFIVRYDPDDMQQAWLYEQVGNDLVFVAAADNVEAHRFHIATQDHTDGEKARIAKFQADRRKDNAERKEKGRQLAAAHGMLPDQIATRQIAELREAGVELKLDSRKRKNKPSMADIYRDDDAYQPVSLYGGGSDRNELEEA